MASDRTTATRPFDFADRLEALVARKRRHTDQKREVYQSLDTDDHGSILMPEPPDEYAPQSNHENGGSYGPRCIGENFGALLAALPPYVDPMSSLLGAWYIDRPRYRGGPHWPPDPDFDYSHLHAAQKKYNIISGIGGQHHFCPEVRIGFELGWGGILEKIRRHRQNPPEGAEEGFYEGHEATLLGIQAWMRKHVERARQMAAEEEDGQIRLMLHSIDRFGSGGSRADDFAVRLTRLFVDISKESPTPDGFNCVPGLFSWASTIPMGRAVGATPNGRRAHAPISHGANPDPGFKDAGAATAMAMAVLSVQCGYGNTVPLQMELDPGIARQEDGIEKMKALIGTYCEMGGTLMNLNVLSKEQVLEAHRDPTKHPDLIVRVTGFSAYFRLLSQEFRQLVVDRIIADS